ncbi:MAG: TIGR02757 family protein [Myxococcota bacterium]|nr:TIGR02757 family protein [Myxococcota bacterium]
MSAIQEELERMLEEVDYGARVQRDPVRFVHRYADARDRELAGMFAALMAYGRVGLFLPLLDTLFEHMDEQGGPTAWVLGLDVDRELVSLGAFQYRWTRGPHLVLLAATLRGILEDYGSIEALFAEGWEPGHSSIRQSLEAAVSRLRAQAQALAPSCGMSPDDLPRGVKYLFASPRHGSACKRWNLYLRWMVRPAAEGVDSGIWTSIPASHLVLPLDTHTHRISRFIGLTNRKDGSWRTAEEITQNLRKIDPSDPVRFDFALAHLGISGFCKGHRSVDICPSCPLDPICSAPAS